MPNLRSSCGNCKVHCNRSHLSTHDRLLIHASLAASEDQAKSKKVLEDKAREFTKYKVACAKEKSLAANQIPGGNPDPNEIAAEF